MQLIVNKWIKFRRWLDSNSRPLVSEVTALPTEPQPLPIYIFCSLSITTELGYECTVVKHIPVANYRWDSNPVHSCFESNAFTTEAQFILLPSLYERLHFKSYLNISSWLIWDLYSWYYILICKQLHKSMHKNGLLAPKWFEPILFLLRVKRVSNKARSSLIFKSKTGDRGRS